MTDNNERTYFTNLEALEKILEFIGNDYEGCYEDLHKEIFNSDYYIVGTYQAKKALEEYGVFEAIKKVMEYEKYNFGEVLTEIHDPEKLANMLWYIIGEDVLSYNDNINKIQAAIKKNEGGEA